MSLLGDVAKFVVREVVGAAVKDGATTLLHQAGEHVGNAFGEMWGKIVNPDYLVPVDDDEDEEGPDKTPSTSSESVT